METIEWSLFPTRRDAPGGLALDLAAYRRRRKSLTHSALQDLVRAATSESRPITSLFVNPLTLGSDALRFVGELLQSRHRATTLRELVFHCPVDFLDPLSALPSDDGSSSNHSVMDRSSVDQLLRVASSQVCARDGAGLSRLRGFRSNVLPNDPRALADFLRAATHLEELSLGDHQSGLAWDVEHRRRHRGTICVDIASAILLGLTSASLHTVMLRNVDGDGLPRLVSGLGSIACVELELNVTAPLMAAVQVLVETENGIRHLALRNTGSRDVDCGPLLSSLRSNASIQTMKLSRFAFSRCCAPLGASKDERNAALEDLSLIDCVIEAESLALPVRGLRRFSLQGCRLASGGTSRHSLLVQGSDAMVQRMVLQATISSFRVWGCRASPDEVFFCRDLKTVEQLLALVIENPGLTTVECIGTPKAFSDQNDKFEYFLRLNQAGRARDVERDIPLHLFPTMWARYSTTDFRHNPSILRHFVKRLAPLAVAAAYSKCKIDS